MDTAEKITEYIAQGCSMEKGLGVELEHFVCDKENRTASYDTIVSCMREAAKEHYWELQYVEGHILGMKCGEYYLSLEPAAQLEISILPQSDIAVIEAAYDGFREIWDRLLAERGYHFVAKGVSPLVEDGRLRPDDIGLIPKKRYQYMDAYFQGTGRHGRHMMRATASLQVSIDYSSLQDAARKLRLLEILSPLFGLLMENKNGAADQRLWREHLLRQQIWNDVDPDRCGYVPGSLSRDFSIEDYCRYICKKPLVVMSRNGEAEPTDECAEEIADAASSGQIAAASLDGCSSIAAVSHGQDFEGTDPDGQVFLGGMEDELQFIEYVLSMFFFNIRLKQYIEIRVADSVPKRKMLGYAALIKGLMYSEDALQELEEIFEQVGDIGELLQAENAIMDRGYAAAVYGRNAAELLGRIYQIASAHLADRKDRKYLRGILTLPILEQFYIDCVDAAGAEHRDSAISERCYMQRSTAKYHGRTVRTLYVPKLFSEDEIGLFSDVIGTLYGIFDKVIREYKESRAYRDLFGFPKVTEEMILRQSRYSCNIPIARIDLFYHEDTGAFKFCEFNTDGTSAMNEDRELNNALKLTKAFRIFQEDFHVRTFELFDSWVEEFLRIYAEYARNMDAGKLRKNNVSQGTWKDDIYGDMPCGMLNGGTIRNMPQAELPKPHAAIVDFLDMGTTNEFEIFRQAFEKRQVPCEICDIRELKWDGKKLYAPSGMVIDAVYRRAVTGDIEKHLPEITDFMEAVREDGVCLIGDFQTQIVHHKKLFEVLHRPETKAILTEEENRFVEKHVPFTISLREELLNGSLDSGGTGNLDSGLKSGEADNLNNSLESGGHGSLLEKVLQEKDNWIIKPQDSYGSKGVLAGVECDAEKWRSYVRECMGKGYILQEFYTPYTLQNIDMENGEGWKEVSSLTGLFVYGGKLKGIYSRISYDRIISTQYNEMAVPTIVAG